MKQVLCLTALIVASSTVVGQQQPLTYPYGTTTSKSDFYEFKWPVKKVAVIGAAWEQGYEVDIYERDTVSSGNWHYTEETAVDAPIPNAPIAVGDYVPSLPPKGAKLPYTEEYTDEEVAYTYRRIHRAPKPVWASLKSNAPAPIQQIRETPWPKGTEWDLPHAKSGRYLRAFSSWHGINANDDNPHTFYKTRVELVERKEVGWRLIAKELVEAERNVTRATWTERHYDAVVVATGRYNAPNVPSIPGLEQWNENFPGRLQHSRQYRRPEGYEGKTILVIGAGNSGGEIARELLYHAKKVIVSVRPDTFKGPHFSKDIFIALLLPNITLVGEIKAFDNPASAIEGSDITLVNGTVISGVDHVIFGSGYRYSYPFLPQYHNSSLGTNGTLPCEEGITQPLVTDGTHVRSLYLDAFYIPDPTLLFIDMNFGMQSFTWAEYVSLAAAKVWSGTADLPNTSALWEWFDDTVVDRLGFGRHFQFYGAERTQKALRFFVGWLNSAAIKCGGRQIDNLPADTAQVSALWVAARFGITARANNIPGYFVPDAVDSGSPGVKKIDPSEPWVQDLVYSDWW